MYRLSAVYFIQYWICQSIADVWANLHPPLSLCGNTVSFYLFNFTVLVKEKAELYFSHGQHGKIFKTILQIFDRIAVHSSYRITWVALCPQGTPSLGCWRPFDGKDEILLDAVVLWAEGYMCKWVDNVPAAKKEKKKKRHNNVLSRLYCAIITPSKWSWSVLSAKFLHWHTTVTYQSKEGAYW